MDTSDVCVIVPAYNEAGVIGDSIADLCRSFEHVVVIDDGSTDRSGDLARGAGATVLRHPVNLGQGAALQTGFDYVRDRTDARFCVTFDADGQHLVADALAMVDIARTSDVDVVLASRFRGTTERMPFARRVLLTMALQFSRWTSRLDVSDTHNGLRLLNRNALDRIRLTQPRMAYASELEAAIVPNRLSYTEIPVSVIYTDYSRAKGQQNINAVNILFDLAAQRLRPAR